MYTVGLELEKYFRNRYGFALENLLSIEKKSKANLRPQMEKSIVPEISAPRTTEDCRYVFVGKDGKPKRLTWGEMERIDQAITSKSQQMENLVLIPVSKEEFFATIENIVRKVLSETQPVPPTKDDDELITFEQARTLLKISRPTLTAWTEDGIVTGYRIGTRLRYKKAEVLAALGKIQKYSRTVKEM